ncbi:MAG: ribonuclease Z, partial [Bacteroidota bacterium]|nr:ribonuclease Z [Bacteroidota bacterium]
VSLKSIPDSIAEDLICVPTHKEAYDLIEMEEIQRDLGF